jgi:hypothetical protein
MLGLTRGLTGILRASIGFVGRTTSPSRRSGYARAKLMTAEIDPYDIGLLSQHTLNSIVRDEMRDMLMDDIIHKNKRNHHKRMTGWFDQFGGVPKTPTTIYEFNEAGDVVPVVYENILTHPKVSPKLGRPRA